MSYSQKLLPNNAAMFPEPPEWLVWQSYGDADAGQVRHMDTLTKAKKHVSTYDNRAFYGNWAIYHWDGDKYTLQYQGKKGELKTDNVLFQERIPRGLVKPREIKEDELKAAINSIMGVSQ